MNKNIQLLQEEIKGYQKQIDKNNTSLLRLSHELKTAIGDNISGVDSYSTNYIQTKVNEIQRKTDELKENTHKMEMCQFILSEMKNDFNEKEVKEWLDPNNYLDEQSGMPL